MANKTAMQELLEWVRKTLPMDLDTPRMIEDKIESLLKVEKEQIKDAFVECWKSNVQEGIECKLSAEEYYNETYGNANEKRN
jgi:hypothetical protein